MLPYQLMMPQLQANKEMAQTYEAEQSGNQHNAMAQYLPGLYGARENALNSQATARAGWKMVPGQTYSDPDTNKSYSVMSNPAGQMRVVDPITNLEAPADAQLRFQTRGTSGNPNSDYVLSGIQRRIDAGDPTAQGDLQRFINTQQQIAGAHSSGTQGVTQPIKEQTDFLQAELKRAGDIAPKIPSISDINKKYKDTTNMDFVLNPDGIIEKEQQDAQTKRDQFYSGVSQYQASEAWKHGVGYQDWLKNPNAAAAKPQIQPKSKPANSAAQPDTTKKPLPF
jgi:hypothetical protein